MPLPPGPSMPGLLQTAAMLSRPHGFLQRCRRRHGSAFTVHVAPYGQMVFLADPRLIRQVFTGDIHVFHVGGVRSRILSPLLGEHSLLLLDEERHMRERKLMLPAFHGEALRRYPELIREIAEAEAASWPLGEELPLRPRMQAITLEVILRVVIGVRDPERLARLRALLGRAARRGHAAALPRHRLRPRPLVVPALAAVHLDARQGRRADLRRDPHSAGPTRPATTSCRCSSRAAAMATTL